MKPAVKASVYLLLLLFACTCTIVHVLWQQIGVLSRRGGSSHRTRPPAAQSRQWLPPVARIRQLRASPTAPWHSDAMPQR